MNYATILPYIEKKLISEQAHPEDPDVRIFNYTQKCQFEKAWDDVTKQCRGLILNVKTGEILARPFPKFFNYEEHIANGASIPGEEPVKFEKYDGSLGILYWLHGKPWIATRGSFMSEQAVWATQWFREHGGDSWPYRKDFTYLFEIIYPANRIVVNYDFSGLVYLTCIHTSGAGEPDVFLDMPPHFRVAESHQKPLESLRSEERENSEGYVLWWPEHGLRLKIKHKEYVRLHRLITGVSKIAIWEHLAAGNGLEQLLEKVPDEFFKWVKEVEHELVRKYQLIQHHAKEVIQGINVSWDRKEIAKYIMSSSHVPGVCFAMLDDKGFDKLIWKLVRPKGERPFRIDTEA